MSELVHIKYFYEDIYGEINKGSFLLLENITLKELLDLIVTKSEITFLSNRKYHVYNGEDINILLGDIVKVDDENFDINVYNEVPVLDLIDRSISVIK